MSLVDLQDILQNTTHFTERITEKYSFRGSSMPYCATRDALTACRKAANRLPESETKFEFQMAAKIGTAIHEMYQETLSKLGVLFGHWKCGQCGAFKKYKIGPTYCCNALCQYVEIHLKDPESSFSGHIDGILKTGTGFTLVDFKTKPKSKIADIEVSREYRSQLLSYKYIISNPPYSIPIDNQAIIYIARDYPKFFKIIEVESGDMEDIELEFNWYRRSEKRKEKALETGDLKNLPMICSSASDSPFCPYSPICFNPDREVILEGEWEHYKTSLDMSKVR